jgi:hypothetical protein
MVLQFKEVQLGVILSTRLWWLILKYRRPVRTSLSSAQHRHADSVLVRHRGERCPVCQFTLGVLFGFGGDDLAATCLSNHLNGSVMKTVAERTTGRLWKTNREELISKGQAYTPALLDISPPSPIGGSPQTITPPSRRT